MNILKSSLTALALGTITLSGAAMADQKETVQIFYDYLSNPGSEQHAEAFKAHSSEDWQSIGDYSGKTKSRDAFIGQLGGFAQLIPDLNWQVEEMLEADNRVIVRGRATGTPQGPFFGVDGEGRGFDIMSIDIHTIEDGKVTTTYHVEDWATALQQLSGK